MSNWPAGTDREVFDTIDSTNAEARRRANGLQRPIWLLAHEQTAGVGRRGRAWSTSAGNFAATYLFQTDQPAMERGLYSFVTSLALADAVSALGVSPDRISLKWPNDVLLDGGKLAGILLESLGDYVAIGIGINLQGAPEAEKMDSSAMRPRSLQDAGLEVDAETVLDQLAAAMAHRMTEFQTLGFTPTRIAWLNQAAKLGEKITARTPTREITGFFETVDEQGACILQAPDGRHEVMAADIFFGEV